MRLVTLRPQDEFPRVDVTEPNADMLELLLLHRETITLSHASAEHINFLYKLGHASLTLAAAGYLAETVQTEAFSFGISTFEAVAALVRPSPGEASGKKSFIHHIVLTTHKKLDENFIGAVSDAREVFEEEMPRTTQLVGQSASRFCRDYMDYAVSGAALARQLEIDATN